MRRDVIVVGASAGGVEALRTLCAGLPADLPAAVLVVLHVPSYGASALPAILDRAGPLPVRLASDDEPLAEATIYLAAPDRHLVVRDDHVALTRGPKENGHRPAVDVLFRSAARAKDSQVVAVVLSGTMDDGTAGLTAVASRGGTTMVQEPADALYPGMPRSAIEHVTVDHVLPVTQMGGVLARLCNEDIVPNGEPPSPLLQIETGLALMSDDAMNDAERPGVPSGFSCPDCNGVLWQIEDGDMVRYRCRVGHAWSSESLFGEQTTRLDDALWMALRGLEEKAALARTMGERAFARRNPQLADRFEQKALEATRAASTIRALLDTHLGLGDDAPATAQ